MRLTTGIIFIGLLIFSSNSNAVVLDKNCVISVLNRTIQVAPDGGWSLSNVPSNMGQVRARATCVVNGQTSSGQSDYFTVVRNGITDVSDIIFNNDDPIPSSLDFQPANSETINAIDATLRLSVLATFPNGSTADVSNPSSGINYSSTNSAIASVNSNGLVTAKTTGQALITARKDGAIAVKLIRVNTNGDSDNDGLPDDYEQTNGLNPNDPIDAQEDQDRDGLTALQEYEAGTEIRVADTDGDGLTDGQEVLSGADGYISNPLLLDTDGDGLNDYLEVTLASNPSDANDHNYDAAVTDFIVSPSSFSLVNNTIQPDDVGQQLRVTGTLPDGSTIDLTPTSRGTNYLSSELTVCNFGLDSGLIYGASEGSCEITISNGSFQQVVSASVFSFDPTAVSVVSIGSANNVDVAGDFAFVAAGNSGLAVVELGDRQNPEVVATLDTPGTSYDIKVQAGVAYIADGSSGLQIVDVSDPLSPSLLGSIDTPNNAEDVQVQNGIAYIADGTSGLQIADVSNPTQPTLIGQINGIGSANGVDVLGNIAVVGSTTGIYTVDVSNPSFPVLLASLSLTNVRDLTIDGNFVHVAAYTTGFRVIDISDPQNLTIVGQGTSSDFIGNDVVVNANIAFYAEQLFPNAIAYVNVKNPEASVFSGTIDLSRFGNYTGTGIALDQQFAYVTGGSVLMIAQYRQISDNEGIAPEVSIASPIDSQQFIQGETLTVNVDATDDVFVAHVQLLVNDQVVATDTGLPYQLRYQTASDYVGPLVLKAAATDLGNNSTTGSVITVQITEDPMTIVVGQVVDNAGVAVPNASVVCSGQTANSNAEGNFQVSQVPSIANVGCTASVTIGGTQYTGLAAPVPPVRSGTTSIGVITVQSAIFDSEFGTGLNQSDDDYDFVTFTDGFSFPYFGVPYPGVYVNSNGRLTFNSGDSTYTESFSDFTNQPQIAVFFDDLDPARAGDVFYKQMSDRFIVTWDRVAHFQFGGSNTIQMTLYADGRITFAYNGLTAQGAFVGVSTGDSLGATALDLSGAPFSVAQPVSIYEAFIIGSNNFDLDGNFILFTPQGNGFDVDVVPLNIP